MTNNFCLYLAPTPIGNLEEVSSRFVRILSQVEVIFCEDTRQAGKLLKHLDITTKPKLIAYNNFNETKQDKLILEVFTKYQQGMLISNAGAPTISDPGHQIIKLAQSNQVKLIPLSGPSALINLAMLCSQPYQKLSFIGFLPKKENQILNLLSQVASDELLIFFESPQRIIKTLELIAKNFANANLTIGREMTKIHEEFYHGLAKDILTSFKAKGEISVAFFIGDKKQIVEDKKLIAELNDLLKKKLSPKQASTNLALKYNLSKNYIYNLYLKSK